jgi:hypothetical protein
MKKNTALLLFVSTLLLTVALVPTVAFCQDEPSQHQPEKSTSTPGYASSPTPPETKTSNQPTLLPQKTPLFTTPTPSPAQKLKSAQSDFNFASLTLPAIVVGVCAVGGVSTVVLMKKRRVSESSLRRMSSIEFQNWVVKRLGGTAGSGGGIDGYTLSGTPVMIKQSDDVDRMTVEKFAAELARSRKRQGMIVAFGFGGDAIRGKVRAKMSYRLDVEMVTVSELIYSKRMF